MHIKRPRKYNQPLANPSKSQTKKDDGKTKKEIGKWCGFHKISWKNTDECFKKCSLVAKMKASVLDLDYEYDSDTYKGKKIIDAEPS